MNKIIDEVIVMSFITVVGGVVLGVLLIVAGIIVKKSS